LPAARLLRGENRRDFAMSQPAARRRCVFAAALLLAGALAGCQTDGPDSTGGVGGPFAEAPQAPAPPEPQPQPPAPQAEAQPLQRHQAALQCWAAVEKDHPKLSIDRRADFVTACIAKMMKASAQQAATPPAKPPAKPKS